MATLQTFGGGTTDFILDPSNNAKPLANTPYTIIDATTLLPATGLLDAAGVSTTQLVSDAYGRYAGSAMLEGSAYYLEATGSDAAVYRFGPMVTTTSVAQAVDMLPQVGLLAEDAQAARVAAEAVGTTSVATIDTHLGGDATNLVPVVAAKPDTAALGLSLPASIGLTQIQAAADSAATFGTRLTVAGSITTSTTLTVTSDADLSGLTINYSGTGTALVVGSAATPLRRKRFIKLPMVVNTAKAATGWAAVAGSVGVKVINLYSCNVEVQYVSGFETGLQVTGASSQGTSYTDFFLGHLDNNKVNVQLTADSTGWVNQNTFYGGRTTHNSGEGSQVAGTRQVLISSTTNLVNGNQFISTSLESPDVVEYHIECYGQYNRFTNCRFENTGGDAHRRIWSRGTAKGNRIDGGFNAGQITQVAEGTAYPFEVASDVQHRRYGGDSTTSVMLLENVVSSSGPIVRTLAAGATLAGSNPATAWTMEQTALKYKGKQAADANSRLELDHTTGRFLFGDGTTAPSKYLGDFGVAIGVNGASLYFTADNTNDIGALSSNRPRYIRAGTAIVTKANTTAGRVAASSAGAGAHYYDTTLNKPVWSDGTNWRDATGTIV